MELEAVLGREELAAVRLRALYRKYGYLRYKMNKFEEYDFYARNKDFLVSEGIITFTDTNGKLMALKPDVTLSIIKNFRPQPGCVQKVYYEENVYRISDGTHSFKEILQAGLECLGDVGIYDICEVLLMAAQSLSEIAENWSLAISHLGLLSGVMDRCGVPQSLRPQLMNALHRRNSRELSALCADRCPGAAVLLSEICSLYLPLQEGICKLESLCPNQQAALAELKAVAETVDAPLYLDFSIAGSMEYYSGIAFNGYVEGLPGSVLSGGAYDNLLRRMGKKGGGVGFAVYLDQFERYGKEERDYDVDVLLLCPEDAEPARIAEAVRSLTEAGETVLAQRSRPEHLRCRRTLTLDGKDGADLA